MRSTVEKTRKNRLAAGCGRARTLRRASAVVEMAIVTPILITLLLGIIEYGWVFTIRQALANAAREGARVAVLPGSTDAQITQRVQDYLTPLGMTTQTLTLTRASAGNPIETVALEIPYADVTLIGAYFGPQNYNLGHIVSMRKEGIE